MTKVHNDVGGVASYPQQQPKIPRVSKLNLGCPTLLFILIGTIGLYPFAVFLLSIIGIFTFLLGLILLPIYIYFRSWWKYNCLFEKVLFLIYQNGLIGSERPTPEEHMPIALLRPRGKLKKYNLDYALNLLVPDSSEEDFTKKAAKPFYLKFLENNLRKLPHILSTPAADFAPSENPVDYVMKRLGSIYPEIYQKWDDKQSDAALTRLCFFGMGAHRVEVLGKENGSKRFVVRTNQLAELPVHEGLETYGGDCYFDEKWRVVEIVFKELDDWKVSERVVRPTDNENDWGYAKFRFRSSLSVLVTLVDHLYGVHMQVSNFLVIAVRENLGPNHPVRRLLTAFMYRTISVNSNARNFLINPGSMGTRCFGFTDGGMQLAWASAPHIVFNPSKLFSDNIINLKKTLDKEAIVQLAKEHGLDTPYLQQSLKFWKILKTFITNYLDYYYETDEDLVKDKDVVEMLAEFTKSVEFTSPEILGIDDTGMRSASPEYIRSAIINVLVTYCFLVTAGHEQVGAIEAYVQDVSFCAFRWRKGCIQGDKQTAICQALLMAFTSQPMPLLQSNWSVLFLPNDAEKDRRAAENGKLTPQQSFNKLQQDFGELETFTKKWNDEASSREFPFCYPIYSFIPSVLESSVSV